MGWVGVVLSIHDAAHYLRQLILPQSRRQCLAYWRERYGEVYVASIKKKVKEGK